jgi:hypothetical protein
LIEFQTVMVDKARSDGMELSFTTVSGADHYVDCRADGTLAGIDWGTGDFVTSDVTRASDLWREKLRGVEVAAWVWDVEEGIGVRGKGSRVWCVPSSRAYVSIPRCS